MFLDTALPPDRRPASAPRVLLLVLAVVVVLPTQLIDPGLVGSLLHRLPRPGDGFDISTGRQLYESAQLVAIPLGAAAFVQVAALAVTFAGILMLALLA